MYRLYNIKPFLTNRFSHHYHLGESTFILRDIRGDFELLCHILNRPRWVAEFGGVPSGAMLFAYVPYIMLKLVKTIILFGNFIFMCEHMIYAYDLVHCIVMFLSSALVCL